MKLSNHQPIPRRIKKNIYHCNIFIVIVLTFINLINLITYTCTSTICSYGYGYSYRYSNNYFFIMASPSSAPSSSSSFHRHINNKLIVSSRNYNYLYNQITTRSRNVKMKPTNYHSKSLSTLTAFSFLSNRNYYKNNYFLDLLSTTKRTTFSYQKFGFTTTLTTSLFTTSKTSTALQKISSLSATRKNQTFQLGDQVHIVNSKDEIFTNKKGCIIEQNGNGWYTIEIQNDYSNDDGSSSSSKNSVKNQIVKKRSSQIIRMIDNNQDVSLSSQQTRNENDKNNSNKKGNSRNDKAVITKLDTMDNTFDELKSQILLTEHIQNIPSLPTIIDLDSIISNQQTYIDNIENKKDIEYIQQCIEFKKYTKWIMFTDLHCSSTSLSTCLSVLDKVYNVAKEEETNGTKTGVLFLGDFWHHRGTVRVDCLNAVLKALSLWDVPMIMIPGNHDQVTLSGLEHALTPLQNAYRITSLDSPTKTFPGILIFSHPTKIHNAMFVPHIRDVGTMQSVLQSKTARSSAAVFVHADVTGAYMNDMIISTHGVSPAYFPSNVPIYSGHFHKPHFVNNAAPGVNIRYVGSPYETTLSEAGQEKSLLVLDTKLDWKCVHEIPLNIGKKHWRTTSIEEFLELKIFKEVSLNDSISGPMSMVMPGDRVVVSVDQEHIELQRQESHAAGLGLCAFDVKVKKLRAMGSSVEIRDAKSIPIDSTNDNTEDDPTIDSTLDWLLVEDMSPKTTWSNFLKNEVQRDAIMNSTASMVLDAGNALLDDLECTALESVEKSGISSGSESAMLIFEEITVQGFGPFKEESKYPLKDRGLVLIKGSNEDIGSDSNGTGKSSLVMSALWALTGSIDPRPMQDDKVSDIVNDLSKSAKVTIRGTLDGKPFVIARTKTLSKASLTFIMDEVDLTRQSVKETQLIIEEKLGAGPQILSRTIFHGQHALNGLLEATDTKLKEELSLIVPLKIWQDAATQARKKGRILSKEISELDGMINIRENDINIISQKYTLAKDAVDRKENELIAKEEELQQLTLKSLAEVEEINLDSRYISLHYLEQQINSHEIEVESSLIEHQEDMKPYESKINDINKNLKELSEQLWNEQRENDRLEAALASAQEVRYELEKKWGISDLSDIGSFVSPHTCPTCKSVLHGESHEHLKTDVFDSFSTNDEKIRTLSKLLTFCEEKIASIQSDIDFLETDKNKQICNLEKQEAVWKTNFSKLQSKVQAARSKYAELSSSLSSDLKKLEHQNKLKQLQADAKSELKLHFNGLEMLKNVSNTTKIELDRMSENVEALKLEREAKKGESNVISKVAEYCGARGVQTYVLQNAVLALQLVTRSYLDELSDGSLRLNLRLDDGDRISRTVSVLGSDGSWVDRPLSSLSGGQWRRCSLALSLGFSDLVARRGRLCSSLLVLDEPLTHLDSNGRDNVGKLLRKMISNASANDTTAGMGGLSLSTIIIILQDLVAEELSESFDCIDEVVKSKGHSRIVVDN